jgi:signal transduction histidine kinase
MTDEDRRTKSGLSRRSSGFPWQVCQLCWSAGEYSLPTKRGLRCSHLMSPTHCRFRPKEQNPIRLDILLREVVAELCELGMDLRLGSVAAAEIVVRPLSLKRALRNLLVNAATHGKSATIALFNRGAIARIEILDRGNGIPDNLLERAVEPFFRADPVRSPTGAGLGLAIAREIILRNGGQLTLANAPTGGLAQTITVPIHHPGSAVASHGTQGCDDVRA